MKEKDYRKSMLDFCGNYFSFHGFKFRERIPDGIRFSYEDDMVSDYLKVGFGYNDLWKYYAGGMTYYRKFKFIGNYFTDIENVDKYYDLKRYNSNLSTEFHPRERKRCNVRFRLDESSIKNDEDLITQSRLKIKELFNKSVFPYIEKKSNLNYLNFIWNVLTKPESTGLLDRIVLAQLAGEPDYVELAHTVIRRNFELSKMHREKDDVGIYDGRNKIIEKLLKRLEKADVRSNPYLGSEKHPFFKQENMCDFEYNKKKFSFVPFLFKDVDELFEHNKKLSEFSF